MLKLLIIESCGNFADSLTSALSHSYQIRRCDQPNLAASVIQTYRPDCLIINLSLKGTDGLHILQQSSYTPPAVLAITSVITPFILQSAKECGVSLILQLPCTADTVSRHLANMVRISRLPCRQPDPQAVTRDHLRILGFPEHMAGFRLLCIGIPLYAQDPGQSFSKELYPAIATLSGNDNANQVEIAIRRAICRAWDIRNKAIWEEYFPSMTERPSVRVFISALADKLDLQQYQLLQAQNE